MKNILCSVFFAGLLLMPTASQGETATDPFFPSLQNDPLYDRRTYQRVRDITVNVSWHEAELRTVLRDLTLIVRSTRPIRAYINFRFSDSVTPADRARKVSLTASDVPVYQALEILSRQATFRLKIHRDLVLIESVR